MTHAEINSLAERAAISAIDAHGVDHVPSAAVAFDYNAARAPVASKPRSDAHDVIRSADVHPRKRHRKYQGTGPRDIPDAQLNLTFTIGPVHHLTQDDPFQR